MLQSMTIATANVMHVDAILDNGATASIFPLNYHNLSKLCKYPKPSHAIMADSTSQLTLYGTAMYGSIPVIVGDICDTAVRTQYVLPVTSPVHT